MASCPVTCRYITSGMSAIGDSDFDTLYAILNRHDFHHTLVLMNILRPTHLPLDWPVAHWHADTPPLVHQWNVSHWWFWFWQTNAINNKILRPTQPPQSGQLRTDMLIHHQWNFSDRWFWFWQSFRHDFHHTLVLVKIFEPDTPPFRAASCAEWHADTPPMEC